MEFVITAKGFGVAEILQTTGDGCVLLHINAQIEKILVFARHRFAIQTARFAGENALENVADPCGLFAAIGVQVGILLLLVLVVFTPCVGRLIAFRDNNFVDVIDEKVQEFMGILLHVVVEIHFFFAKSGNEFLGSNRAYFLLLSCNGIEQIGQT